MYEVIEGLGIGQVQMRISNRKILMGFLDSLYFESADTNQNKIDFHFKQNILREVDKIEKITWPEVAKNIDKMSFSYGITGFSQSLKPFLETAFSKKFTPNDDILEAFQENPNIDTSNPVFMEGIEELQYVLDNLSHLPEGLVVADLSIVRGLDYYTGTVYETQLLDVPEFTGSVCSGGRYDNLASGYINKKLPGVGISLGFSRLFDVIRQQRPDLLEVGAKCPTDILVYTEDSDLKTKANETAQTLRKNGWNVEVFDTVKKWDKHFKYAKNKGIPNILYVNADSFERKNIASDQKSNINPAQWVKNV